MMYQKLYLVVYRLNLLTAQLNNLMKLLLKEKKQKEQHPESVATPLSQLEEEMETIRYLISWNTTGIIEFGVWGERSYGQADRDLYLSQYGKDLVSLQLKGSDNSNLA